ncbi:hypothetical protein [Archaeoglobus veneficus]|uniref:Uncharacterized protein n=1 Tax=Archaeoglobus veneficus (strain DSM 11195 / SNP6) TaxID=693661 RepID=F2KPJ4_ARCVS|nr:hypothetical protein [Archaeoglobus veneficus]AEA46425.1 hypothetical protein Arcve_0392 [Archaeoglobus veneficus SNP6]
MGVGVMQGDQSKRVLSLRITMDKTFEDKFNKIKNELGLSSNAEVIRFLVNKYYKEIIGKGGLVGLVFLKLLESLNLAEILDLVNLTDAMPLLGC